MINLAELKPTEVATAVVSVMAFAFAVISFVLNRRYTDRQFRQLNFPDLRFELAGHVPAAIVFRPETRPMPSWYEEATPREFPLFDFTWHNLGSGHAVDIVLELRIPQLGGGIVTCTRLENVESLASGACSTALGLPKQLVKLLPSHARIGRVGGEKSDPEVLYLEPNTLQFVAVATLSWQAPYFGAQRLRRSTYLQITAVGKTYVERWAVQDMARWAYLRSRWSDPFARTRRVTQARVAA